MESIQPEFLTIQVKKLEMEDCIVGYIKSYRHLQHIHSMCFKPWCW